MSGKRNGQSSRICGRDFSGADGSCLCRYDPVSDISRERIAVVDVAAVKAAPEPFHALGRGPMVEAFRNDVTMAALLQRVVADLLRRIERLFQVALFENALLVGELVPAAGEEIALQFPPHRQRAL